ncbi:trypsin-like peptidase domain-containing protein [Modestobacter sp. VKM Ac-2986]|uniref:S1C family serine protease n=1 Tax=Modestobacter sp. VKM Ac-2986 TaxID=3004140 RepID=UPI0022AADB3F|nr:trypsin-like peptidase domain-containing protein [Modestobacter sp. VKM Ac-2986]MCZ2828615.1 trypsin-like peptidase domain-containing protein [Modestobacter sp. VKM Ac-2986]
MNDETTPLSDAQPAPTTTTAPTPRRRRGTRALATGAVGALGVAAGVVIGVQTSGGASAATITPSAATEPAVTFGRGPGSYGTPPGYGSSTAVAAGTATADQVVGVVDIVTELAYSGGEAAGTGMVLTSNGEVLTNDHVVEGATSITVTVLSTGEQYTATVVGTVPTADVAVLQLEDASGLDTVQVDADGVELGEAVTAVGNAGGDPSSTSAAEGTVTALDQSITATSESGTDAERLTGLIETNADVQAGDSGGPLFDADGEVVGMDTAASSGGAVRSYAIPIDTAMDLVGQIEDGVDDATVHQGLPAFLGVSVADGTAGAIIAGVLSDGPADQAGIGAGDVVTALGGTPVDSATDLTTALAAQDPGDEVEVTWTDITGTSQTATVTLVAGPAD